MVALRMRRAGTACDVQPRSRPAVPSGVLILLEDTMPVIDVNIVGAAANARPGLARAIADELGKVLGAPPGHVWVQVRTIDASAYAENSIEVAPDELPAFAEILHRVLPEDDALQAEVTALTEALARILGRSPDRVHIRYAPAAQGRQAFGGRLVR